MKVIDYIHIVIAIPLFYVVSCVDITDEDYIKVMLNNFNEEYTHLMYLRDMAEYHLILKNTQSNEQLYVSNIYVLRNPIGHICIYIYIYIYIYICMM